MKKIDLRINEWYGDDTITLDFPDKWEAKKVTMAGDDAPPLEDGQIRDAFEHPIGSSSIEELAKGKTGRVVILCDDIQRPTPVNPVLPYVIEQLKRAGISASQILIMFGVGAHEPMSMDQWTRKVGLEIVQKYDCINHSCVDNLQYIGKTSYGNEVSINRRFAQADLKIGISGVKRHAPGSGGGGKLIVPGVSGFETIVGFHTLRGGGEWKIKGNDLRNNIQEAAGMAGLNITVNCNYNGKRELIGLHVGDLQDAWIEAVKFGYKMHSTPPIKEKVDIVVMGTYPQSRLESAPDAWPAKKFLKEGGTAVAIHEHALGCWHNHYMEDRFSMAREQRAIAPKRRELAAHAGRVIVLNKMRAWKTTAKFTERTEFLDDWKPISKILQDVHGDRATVAVYPCTKLQFDQTDFPLVI
jgi:nickel-dependent lactate racemase